MQNFRSVLDDFVERVSELLRMPDVSMTLVDLVEIFIISVLFYHVLIWVKKTRAWNLFKGIITILLFVLFAHLFRMNTILWLAQNTFNVGLIALVIIFQPELRHALENIGGRNFFGSFLSIGKTDTKKFEDKTIEELIKACYAMGRVKTGALIVVEDEIRLDEYIRTGIDVDGLVSSQLLIR